MFRNRLPVSSVRLFSSSFSSSSSSGSGSVWSHVVKGPPDPILGLTAAFLQDKNPNKINLGVGSYRNSEGKPHVLRCVLQAEKSILTDTANFDHEYGPIVGIEPFRKRAKELLLGEADSSLLDRTVSTQAVGGTGAVRLAAEFVHRFLSNQGSSSSLSSFSVAHDSSSGKPFAFLPKPSWANHRPILTDAGFVVREYRYYEPSTIGLDLEGLVHDLKNIPNRSFVLLHSCAHNPTGVDPTKDEWKAIANVCLEKGHVCLLDTAYQGFASGDLERDAFAPRLFSSQGIPVLLAQSFAKNMGMYGERVGAMSVVCKDAEEADRVDSQLKILIRPEYSNPPVFGAKVAAKVLSTPELRTLWISEVKEMADRMIGMRLALVKALKSAGSQKDWNHVTKQIGMFCYSGLEGKQVDMLKERFGIYMTRDGRLSISGITPKNVDYLAKAIHTVTTM